MPFACFAITGNPNAVPNGWAEGTTGGNGSEQIIVTSPEEFNTATMKPGASVLWVSGTLQGDCTVETGDKTILGLPGATVEGTLNLSDVDNVIVRNIFVHITTPCTGTSGAGTCEEGPDAVHVAGSTKVWLDHLSILDGNDGNMDITKSADLITITWCKFAYTRTGDAHQFSNLIGAADSVPADSGKLNCTFHHCWWADGVRERMPRVRYGKVHLYNNLYTSTAPSYCIRVGYLADIFAEANAFIGVKNPVNYYNANGVITMKDNYYKNTTGDTASRGTSFTPAYPYAYEDPTAIETGIRSEAGNTITSWSNDAVSTPRRNSERLSGTSVVRIERRSGIRYAVNNSSVSIMLGLYDLFGHCLIGRTPVVPGAALMIPACNGVRILKTAAGGRVSAYLLLEDGIHL